MAVKHFSIILLFVCAPAFAGNWSVQLNGLSYHYDRSLDLNEVNTGLGASYENGHLLTTGGWYKNSYSRTTVYAFTGPTWRWHGVRFGVLAGVVSGYDCDTSMHWTPTLMPIVSIWRLNFTATPWFVAANITIAQF